MVPIHPSKVDTNMKTYLQFMLIRYLFFKEISVCPLQSFVITIEQAIVYDVVNISGMYTISFSDHVILCCLVQGIC